MAYDTKYIKNKIQATKKTSQITKAMNMVSASKLKQSQTMIENYIPFIEKIEDIILNLMESDIVKHPLLTGYDNEQKRVCYIIITSERGLAGPFNNNIYKMFESVYNDGDFVLPLGGRGFNYTKKKYNLLTDELILLRDDVRFEDLLSAISRVIKEFMSRKIDCVKIIYNHFVNTLTQSTIIKQVLPVEIPAKERDLYRPIYDFEGGAEAILDKILPLYIENIVYGMILDSKASEHASRMTAMKNATDNANTVIGKLELMYNRARQQAITLELTDIIGGANAANS